MNIVLDAAFVIAAVAFFKDKLGLSGGATLAAAFVAVLFVALVPPVIALFPATGAILTAVVDAVKLFITAAGGVDFLTLMVKKSK